jgi:AhpD family alkylhydroperoxidase
MIGVTVDHLVSDASIGVSDDFAAGRSAIVSSPHHIVLHSGSLDLRPCAMLVHSHAADHSLASPPSSCYAHSPCFRRDHGRPPGNFQKFRSELNEEILNCGHLGIKRAFALDHQAYEAGALDTKTKELLGLVGSMVLRCDDCITYHLVRAAQLGWSRARKSSTL